MAPALGGAGHVGNPVVIGTNYICIAYLTVRFAGEVITPCPHPRTPGTGLRATVLPPIGSAAA